MRKRRMWSCTTFLGVAAAEAKVVRPASVAVGRSSDHPLDPLTPPYLPVSSSNPALLAAFWSSLGIQSASLSPKSNLGSAGPLALAVSEPRTEPDEPNPISPPLLASFSLLLANPPISPHPTPPGPATPPLRQSFSLARRWETPHHPPPRKSRGQSPRSRPLSITRPLTQTTRPPSRARSLPVGQERSRQPKGLRATARASRATRRRARVGRRASTAGRRAHLPRPPTTAPSAPTATTEACPSGTAARTRVRAR